MSLGYLLRSRLKENEVAEDLIDFSVYVADIFFKRFFEEYFFESDLSVLALDKMNKVWFSLSNMYNEHDFAFDVHRISVGDGMVCEINVSCLKSPILAGICSPGDRKEIEDFSDKVIRGMKIEYTVKSNTARGPRKRGKRGRR